MALLGIELVERSPDVLIVELISRIIVHELVRLRAMIEYRVAFATACHPVALQTRLGCQSDHAFIGSSPFVGSKCIPGQDTGGVCVLETLLASLPGAQTNYGVGIGVLQFGLARAAALPPRALSASVAVNGDCIGRSLRRRVVNVFDLAEPRYNAHFWCLLLGNQILIGPLR